MQKRQLTLFKVSFDYLAFLLKKSIPYMLAYAVLTILFSGILTPNYFQSYIQSYADNIQMSDRIYRSFMVAYNPYSQLLFPFITIVSIAAALVSFKFLTSRQESDIVFSFPATRSMLFFSSYFSGLISFLIPYILVRNPLPLFAFSNGVDITQFYKAVNDSFSNMLMECLLFIACYSFAVFLCVNIGRIFDVILNYILLSCLLPLCVTSLYQVIFSNLLGIQRTTPSMRSSSISVFFMSLPELIKSFLVNGSPAQKWISVLVYSLFFIVFTILSFYLFSIRKTEKSSVPFAFSYLKVIINIFLSFLFGILFCLMILNGNFDKANFNTLIPAFVVSSFVAYLGISAIAHRSLMIFNKKLFFYSATIAAYGLLIAYIATNGFGVVQYIPEINEVKTVSITTYNDNQYEQPDPQNLYWGKNIDLTQIRKYNNMNILNFSDKEGIEAVTKFHQNLLNHYKEFDYNEKNFSRISYEGNTTSKVYATSSQYGSSVKSYENYSSSDLRISYSPTIIYTLKNGTKVERQYNRILKSWLDESYEKIKSIQPDKENDTNLFQKFLNDNIKEDYFVSYQSPLPFSVPRGKQLNEGNVKRLLKAVYDDEKAINTADQFNAKDYCVLSFGGSNVLDNIIPSKKLNIKENYKLTIAVLKELGIKVVNEVTMPEGCTIEYIYVSYLEPKVKDSLIQNNYSFYDVIFKTNYNNYFNDLWRITEANTTKSQDKKLIESTLKDISNIHTVNEIKGFVAVYKSNNTTSNIFYFEASEETLLNMLE